MSTIIASNISDGTTSVPSTYVVNGSAKAWVNFNGTGTIAARDSFNVASLTDNGTGQYLVTFTSSMQSDNYAVSNSAAGPGSVFECWMGSTYGFPTASNVGLGTGYDTPIVMDTEYVTSTIHGDLA